MKVWVTESTFIKKIMFNRHILGTITSVWLRPKIGCHTWYGQENDIICDPKSSNPNLNGEVCGSGCRKWNCGRKYTCSMHSSLCGRYWGTLWRLFSTASSSHSQFWCQKLRCLYGELSTSHHSLPSWMELPLPSMCCEYIHIPKFF